MAMMFNGRFDINDSVIQRRHLISRRQAYVLIRIQIRNKTKTVK